MGIETVRVDVLVTDRNRPICGLGLDDFEVRDNGILQSVNLVSVDELPIIVVLALDTNASLEGKALDHLRDASVGLLERLRTGDQASLVTLSRDVRLREAPTSDLDRIRRTLGGIEAGGDTALLDGTYTAMMTAEADVGRDLLIVFSDGVDTASWLTPAQVLDAARLVDMVVYGVTVRSTQRPEFLRSLATQTSGELLEVDSTRALNATFVHILDEFRQRYVLSFTPRGVPNNGWHDLAVTVRGRRATVRARPGYLAGRRP